MKEVEPPTEAEIPTELNGGEQMKENLKKPSSIHKDVQNIDVNRDIDLVVLAASEVDSDDQSDMEVESSVCIVDGYGTYMPTTSKSVDAMQAHPVISSSLEEENSPYGAFTTAANMPPIPTSYADNAYSEVLDPYGTFVDLVESEGEPMLATVEVEDTPLIPLSYAEHSPNDIYGAFMGTIESNDASHTPSETSMRPLEERELFLTYIRSLMTNHVERDTMLDSFGEDVEVNEMKCHLYKCAYSYVYKPVLSKQGAKISPTDMENMPIYASSPMSPCLGQIDKSPLDALNNNVRIIQFEVIPTSTDDDNTLPVSHWIWANAWEYLQKMETENYASNIIATECMDHGTTQYANAIKKNPTTSTVVHFESCLKDALTLLLKAAHHSMLCGDLILTVRSLVNIGTVQVKLKNNKSAVSYYLCAIGLLRYLRDAFSNNLIPICHCPNHDSSDSKANTNLNQNLTTICSNYFQHFVFNNKICVVTLEFEKKVLFSLCQCLSSIAIASNNFVGSNIEISVDDINDQKHAYELFILCVQQFLLYTMDPSCSTTSAIAEKEKIIKLLNKTRINNNQ